MLGQDGSVYLEIRAVSKHSNRFYRLVSPAAEAAQRFATKHYVEAARRIAGSRP